MHMADALLSPAVGVSFWAGTFAAIAYASKKLKDTIDDRMIPLMGVLGAFIFAAQMINFTIPGTGSSGHIGGGMILAVILGPFASFLVMASVLTVQGLFFADGGLLALGCNIWNLGIYPCFIVYPLLYRPLVRRDASPRRIVIASILSVVVALQMGAFSVVLETVLSGKSELPFGAFVLLMQPIHLVIGIVEGLITAGVVNYVRSARPELLEGVSTSGKPLRLGKIIIIFAALALITGGWISWYASTHPDGLEWAVQRITGKPSLPAKEEGVAKAFKDVQEKTAVMPEYGFKQPGGEATGGAGTPALPKEAETSAAGIIGAAVVLGAVVLLGFGITMIRKRRG